MSPSGKTQVTSLSAGVRSKYLSGFKSLKVSKQQSLTGSIDLILESFHIAHCTNFVCRLPTDPDWCSTHVLVFSTQVSGVFFFSRLKALFYVSETFISETSAVSIGVVGPSGKDSCLRASSLSSLSPANPGDLASGGRAEEPWFPVVGCL